MRWPVIVFVAGLALTAALAWFAWSGSHARDMARFENAVLEAGGAIETRLEVYTGMLRAGGRTLRRQPGSYCG